MESSLVPNGSTCPDILAAREPCDLLQFLLRTEGREAKHIHCSMEHILQSGLSQDNKKTRQLNSVPAHAIKKSHFNTCAINGVLISLWQLITATLEHDRQLAVSNMGTMYMSKKSGSFLFSNSSYKIGQDIFKYQSYTAQQSAQESQS